jgi:hypothetical protein
MLSSEIPGGSYLGISDDGKLDFSLERGLPVEDEMNRFGFLSLT